MTIDAPFTDDQARAAWNEGARAFEVFVESGADYYRREVHGPALLDASAPVAGKRALDLGCGQGFFTRELARAGARVTGVDVADELIAFAREHESRDSLGIEYHAMSAAAVDRHGRPARSTWSPRAWRFRTWPTSRARWAARTRC